MCQKLSKVFATTSIYIFISTICPNKSFLLSKGYLLLGLVFMTLTLTVFYDIPQLNLGLHLHKHMDIHIRDEQTATGFNNYQLINCVLETNSALWPN